MTSLQFFPPLDPIPQGVPPEWGTGKEKEKSDLWIPKSPNWHYSGELGKQEYVLTKLKLSNLRLNDQLLPRPQDFDMGKIMIDKPFPAEHPYSSHISRFAVFPNYQSPNDPERGYDAHRSLPRHVDIPASPYDVLVKQKTKGFGHRLEHQALPSEGEKKAQKWHDGDTYEHRVKTPTNNQRQFYPSPPKIYMPNSGPRENNKCLSGDMEVSSRTANALKNIELDLLETTYKRAHTGHGPANPNKLDNFDEKQQAKIHGQDPEDELHPHSTPTFDPARPVEGRIARLRDGKGQGQTDKYPDPPSDVNYVRKPTLTEIEEDRLLNGKEYVNLPEMSNANGNNIIQNQETDGTALIPSSALPVPVMSSFQIEPYLEEAFKQHDDIQQMEASNRWRLLESQTPAHNLTARNLKMKITVDKSQPKVFYSHEGKYQRERSGLYKTSYDPYKLQYDMNKEEISGGRLFDISDYHKDALNRSYDLNGEMSDAMRFSRSLGGPPGSVPQLHDQPSQYEAFEPYRKLREAQKNILQPQVQPTDDKTVENGIILKETTYGDGYNTLKFLQEQQVHQAARKEPLLLMSHENQSLANVIKATTPKIPKSLQSEDMLIATGAGSHQMRLNSAPVGIIGHERLIVERPLTTPVIKTRETTRMSLSHLSSANGRHGLDQFASASTNFSPANLRHSWAGESGYKSQFKPSSYIEMGYKRDPRFDWEPGSGVPRPKSTLLRIQDSFSKSDARKKFHMTFPEKNPDLRENLTSGRKHTFGGLNAQVLRGAPVHA